MATTVGSKGAAKAGAGLYLRKATGLVREVSVGQAVILNMLAAVPGLVLAFSIFWILGAFPGVNMVAGMLIAMVFALAIGTAFGLLSVAMPRSGGDYILVSRVLHPALGMISSISLAFSGFLSIGYWAWAWTSLGLSPALQVVGATTGNAGLIQLGTSLNAAPWNLIIGLLSIAGISIVLARGLRATMKLQTIAWWIAFGGLALMGIILLFTGHDTFVTRFNVFAQQYTNQADSYNYFIKAASDNSMSWPGKYSLGPTLAAVGALLTFGMWTWWSTHIAGEMKGGATRKQLWAILLATVIQYTIFIVWTLLLYKTIGEKFIASVNFLSSNPQVYTLPAPPFLVLLVSVIPGGFLIPFVVAFSFLGWLPLVHFAQFVQPIRAFFAMAFDRIAPAKLGEVDERSHAPLAGLLVCIAIGVVCLFWAVFSPTFQTVIVIAGLFGIPPIALVGISAIVFPWRLKDLYKTTPAKMEVFGIPVVAAAGVVAVIAEILYGYVVFKFGLLPPASQLPGVLITVGVVALSAAWYFVSYTVRKGQGIDIRYNFKELPPE